MGLWALFILRCLYTLLAKWREVEIPLPEAWKRAPVPRSGPLKSIHVRRCTSKDGRRQLKITGRNGVLPHTTEYEVKGTQARYLLKALKSFLFHYYFFSPSFSQIIHAPIHKYPALPQFLRKPRAVQPRRWQCAPFGVPPRNSWLGIHASTGFIPPGCPAPSSIGEQTLRIQLSTQE